MNNEKYFSNFDENEDADNYTDPNEIDLDDEDLETIEDDSDSEDEEEEQY